MNSSKRYAPFEDPQKNFTAMTQKQYDTILSRYKRHFEHLEMPEPVMPTIIGRPPSSRPWKRCSKRQQRQRFYSPAELRFKRLLKKSDERWEALGAAINAGQIQDMWISQTSKGLAFSIASSTPSV